MHTLLATYAALRPPWSWLSKCPVLSIVTEASRFSKDLVGYHHDILIYCRTRDRSYALLVGYPKLEDSGSLGCVELSSLNNNR